MEIEWYNGVIHAEQVVSALARIVAGETQAREIVEFRDDRGNIVVGDGRKPQNNYIKISVDAERWPASRTSGSPEALFFRRMEVYHNGMWRTKLHAPTIASAKLVN